MEISTMVIDLKKKIDAVQKENKSLEELRNTLTQRLSTVESTLRKNIDDLEAMKMAAESLEMIGTKRPEEKQAEITDILPKPTPETKRKTPEPKSTTPKKVKKCDAYGNQLGIWMSISQCAKEHKLSPQTVINMIEKQPRAVLLANRGYYFAYAS